jgi:hypothetical protein
MRKLLIVLIVLLALLVAADRIGLLVAQREIGNRVASSYNLPQRPDVTIRGFPFLTQLASGKYSEIDVLVPSVTRNGVTVQNLQVKLTGVHASLSQLTSGGTSGVTADRATASAVIPYGALQQALQQQVPGATLSGAGGGDLKIAVTLSYAGVRVPVTAGVALGVSPDHTEVRADPVRIAVGGSSVSIPASVLGSKLPPFSVPVRDLPLHLLVTAVHAVAAGIQVTASATNVHLAG